MIPEVDRLCMLKMCHTWKHHIGILLCDIHKCFDILQQQSSDRLCVVLHIESKIQCHLIVSAACGVQTLTRISDTTCQFTLNRHMDIFIITVKFQFSVLNVIKDLRQSCIDLHIIFIRDDPLLLEHIGMCT